MIGTIETTITVEKIAIAVTTMTRIKTVIVETTIIVEKIETAETIIVEKIANVGTTIIVKKIETAKSITKCRNTHINMVTDTFKL